MSGQPVAEFYGLSVHQYQVDFRVRHTHRLDCILYGRSSVKTPQESALATFVREEVIELGVKPKLRGSDDGLVQTATHDSVPRSACPENGTTRRPTTWTT